ncbi:MAG: hydrogenase maturation nickel metallochaperone HypA [Thermoplasmata archaeon]
MHEEAMLQDLRRKLVEVAGREGAPRVARVRLWVGALSHVSEEQLRRQWPRVVEGTPAQSAALDVTASRDLEDPRAQGLVLMSIDVEQGGSTDER